MPVLDGGAVKHPRPRDVPRDVPTGDRTRYSNGQGRPERVQMADGSSFPVHGAGGVPGARGRPPICMLFEDLAPVGPPAGIFGMYPTSLIPKLLPWLRCERHELLHVCSGGLPPGEGFRVDIRPAARPDVVADGRALPFADSTFAGALLDPPYSPHYAKVLYGTDYPRPGQLLAEACRVVRPAGRFALVHYLVANPPRGAHVVKTFGLSMGFGYPMRAVTIYERAQASLF